MSHFATTMMGKSKYYKIKWTLPNGICVIVTNDDNVVVEMYDKNFRKVEEVNVPLEDMHTIANLIIDYEKERT
jgi:uncharacterized protein YbcV (DUF1398 family)|tara:strand:+ start:244 stop:462 length:219 start_codon:yes stop_codon:yes gene_type:complete